MTDRSDNINSVFGIGEQQKRMPPLAFLASTTLVVPTLFYLSDLLMLRAIFRSDVSAAPVGLHMPEPGRVLARR